MIIISPYSRAMRNNCQNPKNYPYWPDVIRLLDNYEIIQVGITGEIKLVNKIFYDLPITNLKSLILECECWISIDNFFQHLASYYKKPGVAIFSQSDPNIFGYPTNINLLKDRKYLRPNQFDIWECSRLIKEAFVSPEEVAKAVKSILK